MEILNLQPIRLLEYIAVKDNLDKADAPAFYAPEFKFSGQKVDLLNFMFVEFSIIYHAGVNNELVFSYKSCTSFNLISEGTDADLKSLMQFIDDYYNHTELFLKQFGVITQQQIEKSMGRNDRLLFGQIANVALDNLRLNNIINT